MFIETITDSLWSFSQYVIENTDPKQKLAMAVGAVGLTYFLSSKLRGWNEECVLSKTIGFREVKLIRKSVGKGKSELFWEVQNRITRMSTRSYAVQDINDCPITYLRVVNSEKIESFRKEYVNLIKSFRGMPAAKVSEWLRRIPISERVGYFRDHEIDLDISAKPTLRRITARSRFDNSIVLDRDNWAVTILCNGANSIEGHLTGHAMVAIEGIKNGIKHTMYAHANGLGSTLSGSVVSLKQGNAEKQSVESVIVKKSETWKRASHLVIKMLDEIQHEAELSENKISPFLFNLVGGRTIFSWCCEWFSSKKHHNCYTWIVEKLEIAKIYAQSNNVLNSFVAIPAREIDGCVIV